MKLGYKAERSLLSSHLHEAAAWKALCNSVQLNQRVAISMEIGEKGNWALTELLQFNTNHSKQVGRSSWGRSAAERSDPTPAPRPGNKFTKLLKPPLKQDKSINMEKNRFQYF